MFQKYLKKYFWNIYCPRDKKMQVRTRGQKKIYDIFEHVEMNVSYMNSSESSQFALGETTFRCFPRTPSNVLSLNVVQYDDNSQFIFRNDFHLHYHVDTWWERIRVHAPSLRISMIGHAPGPHPMLRVSHKMCVSRAKIACFHSTLDGVRGFT